MSCNTAIWDALHASWPPALQEPCGAFVFQESIEGGNRVNAARAHSSATSQDVDKIEARFSKRGRASIFKIRPNDAELDTILLGRNYVLIDETVCFTCSIDTLKRNGSTSFEAHWPPTMSQVNLWQTAGIDAGRLVIMERVRIPKAAISTEGSVAFVAVHNDVAALHALEVAPDFRRQGKGRALVLAAAHWARAHGADTLALLVTQKNTAAIALYSSLGMQQAQGYHYRKKGGQ
jgi:ribosomal protein S18 acetylase RimI-like enzyme